MAGALCSIRQRTAQPADLGDGSQWLLHTQLVQNGCSSMVKETAPVPAKLAGSAICACVRDLDVPKVLRNVSLNLPAKIKVCTDV